MRTFRVWADELQRVFQDIQAATPRQAYDRAQERPETWEQCDEHYDGIRMSNRVQDLETGDFFAIDGMKHCRTCGSEIVNGINESHFREGECGSCEYDRYRTHAKLLTAAYATYGAICDLSHHRCFRWMRRLFQETSTASDLLASAVNDYGKEQ